MPALIAFTPKWKRSASCLVTFLDAMLRLAEHAYDGQRVDDWLAARDAIRKTEAAHA